MGGNFNEKKSLYFFYNYFIYKNHREGTKYTIKKEVPIKEIECILEKLDFSKEIVIYTNKNIGPENFVQSLFMKNKYISDYITVYDGESIKRLLLFAKTEIEKSIKN